MDLLILGSLLLTGGLLSLAGVFDGDDDKDESPPDDVHVGTEGEDTLSGDSGIFRGLHGDDQITVSGTAEARGNHGNDTLTADDDSTAYGGEGQDRIDASGNSLADGGSGDDTLRAHDTSVADGGVGRDSIYGWDATVSYGGSDGDTLRLLDTATGYGGDGRDELTVFDNATGYGGAGPDDISASSNAAAYGGAGNDLMIGSGHVYGDDGDDRLRNASSEDSSLFGGAGDDLIQTGAGHADAGAGNDIIELNWASRHGDLGAEHIGLTVTGGEGGDTFNAIANLAQDDEVFVITDFNPAQDQLNLEIPVEFSGQETIASTAFADHTEITVTLPDITAYIDGSLQTVAQVLHLRLDGVIDPSLLTYNVVYTSGPQS
ncbi:MAG: hypothetical protein V4586_02120 [Pseudomonadota bacterium]